MLSIGVDSRRIPSEDQHDFLDKFSKLQTGGSKAKFVVCMSNLGKWLAPASLLYAVEKSAVVDCSDYDLSHLDYVGFRTIGAAVRASACLRDLTVQGSVLKQVVEVGRWAALDPMFDMTLGKLKTLVLVVGEDPEEHC